MSGIESVVGTWGSAAPGQPQLQIAEDGSVTGTDGCNRLAGKWALENEVVIFQQMISTMMYCEGVGTWLSGAASARVHGNALHVYDRAGLEIGTLERES
ncbi:META domain-containing protein [Corynebacterium casei]|uniref:META domain-containing protein n=2 Tax=Corynebacterium casei TaxID=160386 RepID=UPI002649586F|nr:META domain-containing protein [Corynebacterium casei]MDN6417308.1 META domain-containing protein [Corynebacterium casei]